MIFFFKLYFVPFYRAQDAQNKLSPGKRREFEEKASLIAHTDKTALNHSP